MNEIKIYSDDGYAETRSFTFCGGEIQVKLPGIAELTGDILVLARLQSADSLIQLLLTSELIERLHQDGRRTLVVPYFPYARQDRVMQAGEAFSLKSVARLINGLGFDRVITCDAHSDVTPALVDRIEVVSQLDLVRAHEGIGRIIHSGVTVVAPDAGASKKAFAVAQRFGLPLLTASKSRDVKTGAITRTEIYGESADGRNALIVDDICDGGRTFIELAKVLRQAGAAKVYLYVTHGIFSQGLGVFEGLIDGIFTTDAFVSPYLGQERPVPLHVSKLNFNAKGIAQ